MPLVILVKQVQRWRIGCLPLSLEMRPAAEVLAPSERVVEHRSSCSLCAVLIATSSTHSACIAGRTALLARRIVLDCNKLDA